MKLVPFNPQWLTMDGLDLHAIYRRPQRDPITMAVKRDADGFVQWDIMGPQPITGHNHQNNTAKGYEYVTLATYTDIKNASSEGLLRRGVSPLQDADSYLILGVAARPTPWHLATYLAHEEQAREARVREIAERVEQMGPDGAELFEQQRDPGYRLPVRYRKPKPVQVKRGPGRPKGAKNKPKAEPVTEAEPVLA